MLFYVRPDQTSTEDQTSTAQTAPSTGEIDFSYRGRPAPAPARTARLYEIDFSYAPKTSAPSTGEDLDSTSTSTARDCQSNIVREKFAALGYPQTAQRAIVAWRAGSMGFGHYVTIPARYAFEVEISLFYCESDNSFVFASLHNDSPVLGDALHTSASANNGEDLDQRATSDFENWSIDQRAPGGSLHQHYNGALGGIFDQIPYVADSTGEDLDQTSTQHGGMIVGAAQCYEIIAQYDDWFARRADAILDNNASLIALCDLWINAIVAIMAQIDLI